MCIDTANHPVTVVFSELFGFKMIADPYRPYTITSNPKRMTNKRKKAARTRTGRRS